MYGPMYMYIPVIHSCTAEHVFNCNTIVTGTTVDFNATLCSSHRATDRQHSAVETNIDTIVILN